MANPLNQYDVAIIGAGPAGTMAAIFAAKSGASVILLEKNEHIGRKILATGNGRCNLTNKEINISRYHGKDTSFAVPVFASFDQFETIKFFEALGVVVKEEDPGRVFPRTNQASTVVDTLRQELENLDVKVVCNFIVKTIDHKDNWTIRNDRGDQVVAGNLVLTTGGRAAHQLGSSGDGLFWVRNLGHTIIPIHAALVPVEVSEIWVKELMGIKLSAHVSLLSDEKVKIERDGDLIFTHFGVSGPAIMGLAREIDPLLESDHSVQISIDLLPDIASSKLEGLIESQLTTNNKKMISSIITGLVPKNIVPRILALAEVEGDKRAAEISKADRRKIVSTLKDLRLTVTKVRPLKEAQVTAGGVATAEVSETLESKIVPNLYLAGEILDIDGDSGGFNLQWAWSSGKVAGENAGKRK